MNPNARTVALWTMLAVIGACGLLGVVAVVAPSRYIDERVMIAAFMIGFHALGAMILISISRDQSRFLAAALASLMSSMAIFTTLVVFESRIHWETQELVSKIGVVFIIATIAIGHRMLVAPLLTHRRDAPLVRILKRTSLIATPITGVVLVVALYSSDWVVREEVFLRVFGVGLIVSACSTLALGAMSMLIGKPGEDEPGLLGKRIPVDFTCPRCAQPVHATCGSETRCGSCKLKIVVKVEEPRCSCGYLLYQLESDTCPECGKAINPDDRWGPEPDLGSASA